MNWILILTVCGVPCVSQVVSTHDSKNQCMIAYEEINNMPKDGHWKTVTYECKLKNGAKA